MKRGLFPGCCAIQVIYDLGSAHKWKKGVVTYESFDAFSKVLNKKIKEGINSYDVFVAVTNPEQDQEQYWLKQLGFGEYYLGDGLVLLSITTNKWCELNKETLFYV